MDQNRAISLDDVKLMAQIVKIVTARGAIQAEEMATVGAFYNKLIAIIKANTPAEPENPADANQGENQNG